MKEKIKKVVKDLTDKGDGEQKDFEVKTFSLSNPEKEAMMLRQDCLTLLTYLLNVVRNDSAVYLNNVVLTRVGMRGKEILNLDVDGGKIEVKEPKEKKLDIVVPEGVEVPPKKDEKKPN